MMKYFVIVVFFAGLAAGTMPDGVISTVDIYGHGYKTFVGKDNLLRYGGDVYDSLMGYPDVTYSQRHVYSVPLYVPPVTRYVGRYTVRDLYETPVVILIKSPDKEGHLTHIFANKGIRTILSDPTFKPLVDYLKTPVEKSGIIFNLKTFYHTGLYDVPISKMLVPKGFKVGDVTKFLIHGDEIPMLVILDKVDIDKVKVDSLTDVAKLGVYDTTIEPIDEPTTPFKVKVIH